MVEIKKDYLDGENPTIYLPKINSAIKSDIDWNNINIARGTALLQISLPDPLSTAIKAAINLFAIFEAKILLAVNLAWPRRKRET
jgi:hypothetical protein